MAEYSETLECPRKTIHLDLNNSKKMSEDIEAKTYKIDQVLDDVLSQIKTDIYDIKETIKNDVQTRESELSYVKDSIDIISHSTTISPRTKILSRLDAMFKNIEILMKTLTNITTEMRNVSKIESVILDHDDNIAKFLQKIDKKIDLLLDDRDNAHSSPSSPSSSEEIKIADLNFYRSKSSYELSQEEKDDILREIIQK